MKSTSPEEQKAYVLSNIKTLLNLDDVPYELQSSSALEKFTTTNQASLFIVGLPTKQFKVVFDLNKLPEEGTLITINKIKSSDVALAPFYSISIKPIKSMKTLSSYIKHFYEPMMKVKNEKSLLQVKQLGAVIQNCTKRKLYGQEDLNFTNFVQDFDFWQEEDMNKPSVKSSLIISTLTPIIKQYRNLASLPLQRLSSLIQTTWTVLMKLYNLPQNYSQKRLLRLVEIFQEQIKGKIKISFPKQSDLWNNEEENNQIKNRLMIAIDACSKFIKGGQKMVKISKRKFNLKLKNIEEFHIKLMATYRMKSKVEFLISLFQQKLIAQDPQSLKFLIKIQSFMTNNIAVMKSNPKAQQKLQTQKDKLIKIIGLCVPIIQDEIEKGLQKNNVDYLLKILRKWYYILQDIPSSEKIQEIQSTTIRKVTQFLQIQVKKWKANIQSEKKCSQKLKISQHALSSLEKINILMTSFCQANSVFTTYLTFHQKNTNHFTSLQSIIMTQFNGIYEDYGSNLKKQELNEILGKHIQTLMVSQSGMKYVFTIKKVKQFMNEVKMLVQLGYEYLIKDKILKWYDESSLYLKQNMFISTLQSRYNAVISKLQPFQEELLVKQLQELQTIIKNPKIKKTLGNSSYEWSSVQEASNFSGNLGAAIDKLAEYMKIYNDSQAEIQEICYDLISIEFNQNNFYIIGQKIEQVIKIIQTTSAGRSNNDWKQFWKLKMTEVVTIIWQKALINGISINQTLTPVLVNKKCQYQPTLQQTKQRYYKELKSYIGWPMDNKHLNGDGILTQGVELLKNTYKNVQDKFQHLRESLDQFKNIEEILSIDIDQIQDQLSSKGDISTEQLLPILQNLQSSSHEVEKYPDEISIQNFNLDLIQLKKSIKDQIQDLMNRIMQMVKYSIKVQSQQVEDFINNVMSKLQNKPKNMNQMTEAVKSFEGIKDKQKQIANKIKKIQQKNKHIKSLIGQSYNTGNMLKRWDNFQIASVEMNNILSDQKHRLQEDCIKKGELLQKQSQKCYKQFKNLKPQTQQLSHDQVLDLFSKIKDWQGQWSQIQNTYDSIKRDLQSFKMKMPPFKAYHDIKQKLDNQMGNWIVFMEYRKQVQKIHMEEWITFRRSLFKYSDIVHTFYQKTKNLSFTDSVSKFLKQMLSNNNQSINLLKCLTGENFQKQHWGMLFSLLKIKHITTVDKLLLKDLLEVNLIEKANEIRQLQAKARGQLTIRSALDQLQTWGITRQFELSEYNSMGRLTALIKQWKDVMTEVSDNMAMVISIKQSKYATRFKNQIQKYQIKFGILDSSLLKLNQIQRKWIYLQPIFMRGALPQEQGRWKRLDQDYRNIMNNIFNDPHVIELANIAGFSQTLTTIMAQLQRCQKALNDFLQQKRNKFPRFYFLGDDDMLQILGQSQNPTIIQQHLKKLFSGIHTVKFTQNNDKILSMLSHLKEEVKLNQDIQVSEIVQNWLESLSKNMVSTLKSKLKQIKNNDIQQTFETFPSQIICLTNQIQFSLKCNQAIGNGSNLNSVKKYYQTLLSNLTKKCHQIKNQLVLAKIKSLILDIIHHISIIEVLINSQVKIGSDWNWFKQLTFKEEGDKLAIRMANTTFQYTFQYQGNSQKLVYTPLTDKCYLTLTQSMFMGLGGNPYGPAGTGKTQSVKALALAFGRQVLVFNCDQGLDFMAMGRIFIGLVKCGAWGCFDQFNRLLQQQLSAISQQIQIIQESIKAKQSVINLLGKRVEVNFNSGIFVTLNPAGKGYGGRSKLPDNLKQLFRPIAMSVPDNQLIAEVLLFSQGFNTAKILAQKIITIFTLSKQLLSKQLHYDWGLRALKTILTVAGRLVFQQKGEKNQAVQSQILIKALRINTISKLTFNDMLKFNVLVEDVFPGINIKDIIYEQISQAIQKVFTQQKFQILPNQLNKILQFYEATKQRIGAVLVGPSGCGKTTIWKSLKKAYEKLNQVVKIHLINPKAMPRSKFLGHMNNDTRQFSEGVLTMSARQVIKQEHQTLNWIVCDGDVDPEWIQALNSVLDDNHLLTLPTGQRISFGSNVNFIFQTDNLQFASPATISRMGMIFMNDQDINITSIIKKWSKTLPQSKQFLTNHLKMIEDSCVQVYEKYHSKQIVQTTKVGLVRNAISLLQNSNNQTQFKLLLVKGLSSNFDLEVRTAIFQQVFQKPVPGGRDPLSLRLSNQKIGEYKDDIEQNTLQRIYMTKQIKKDIEIVTHWLRHNQNVIIVGKQGCGKSLLLQASIAQLQKVQKCRLVTLHCNRETKSSHLIQKLFSSCQKVTSAYGRTLKPQNCSKQIFILKEINLSKPDKYSTIQLITFIQSLITHEGFYDNNLQFVRLGEGIQFVCAMKPSSTIGRFQLTSRFISNLRVLKVQYGSVGTKQKLQILTKHAQSVDQKLQQVWKIINQNFKPDDHAHYLFAPRNLNSIVDCLQNYLIDLNSQKQLYSALNNEVIRQFGDRLVTSSDKEKFKALLKPVFGNISQTDYLYSSQQRKLKPCPRSQYVQILKSYIKDYENQIKQANIVLVDQNIDLFAAIQKKIIQKGAMLLAGSSGNLRKTACRIVCHKHKIQLMTLSNMRNPSLKQFFKDLRNIFEVAAGQNKQIMLYLQEHQLGKSQFYQKINNLISSGQIGGLFAADEIQNIVQDLEVLKSQYPGKNLYQSFVQRIKRNITVILSLDSRNKQFYQICSANPAFFSFSRIVWLNCYQRKSLQKIYDSKVQKLKLKNPQELKKAFVKIHFGSSQKYIQLLNNFVSIFNKVQSKSGNKLQKLTMGLKKLSETAKMVDKLTADALSKKKLLTEKQKEADESLNYITDAMQQASISKQQAKKLKSFLEVQEKKIEKDRHIVMSQLQKVRPLIEEAKTAVSGLTPKNIQQIRAFMNPPQAVRHVLKAVLSLFGNRDDSWNSMKNFLKICKDQILLFDIKQINQKVRKQVQQIITQHAYSFQRQNVFKASQDAVPLADWVKAAIQYSRTYEKVRPLQQNLNKIQKQLSRSKIRLTQCIEKQIQLTQKVKQLNENFVKTTNQAQVLREQLQKANKALQSGKQLLQKLKDEKVRWEKDSDKLKIEVQMMPRYAVMTACFVTYLSECPQNERLQKVNQWKKTLQCHFFNFLSFITTEAVTLEQVLKGLPNDQLSIQNSQIIGLSSSISLIIDPHTQATTWLKQKLKLEGTVQTLTQQDPKFINTLQLSIRFGKILVVQQIDYIQPILMPIIKKDFTRQGSRNIVQIGQKFIDVSETFKLFLASRNSSISIPYNQKDHVSFINFSVTRSGLESKLLSIIITHFQPEIQKQKQELLSQQQKLKIQLVQLQEKLLKQLADSTGNILQNKSLIDSLNKTKVQSQVVGQSLKESSRLQESLDEKRLVYKPISELGSKLYLSLGILSQLSPMYKYSLAQFIILFSQALQASSQISKVKQELTKIVYDNISIGLMKVHRLLLAIIFVKEVFEQEGIIKKQQFDFLLGNVVINSNSKGNVPQWLDEKQADQFKLFLNITGSREDFQSEQWEKWFKIHDSQDHFPQKTSLTDFQKCLLIKICRPDRLINSLTIFTLKQLSLHTLSGLNVNMKVLTQQKMSSNVPALFIVSVGFDPSKQIQQYANSTIGKDKFKELSMGGQQNQYALQLIREAAKQGKWVCLKNLHLVISFVSVLQKQLLGIQCHESFRLFLTTQSHQKFPPILLESCYKISYEAPPGLKQNFSRLLQSSSVSSSQITNPLEYVLTYFHSIVQQRRNYNPQGWLKLYEFNYGDYKAGMQVIGQLAKQFQVNWKMLYGLMLDTVYGGRIDNQVDMRLLDVYLKQFFNPEILAGKKPVYNSYLITKPYDLLQALPDIDNPGLYSLPLGIDKTILRLKSKELLQNLKVVTLTSSEDLKFNRQIWLKHLETFFTLWKNLLQSIGKLQPISDSKLKSVDPIQSFIYGQYSEAINNFESIKSGLKKLYGVLYGNQILTTQIQQLGKYLVKGQTYIKWRKIWQGPDLLIQWISTFVDKLNHLQKWKASIEKGSLLNQELDLSEVYRPQIFFNALKQKIGRQRKIPINKLKIKCSFTKPQNQIFVKIKSIILQGGSHSKNILIDTNHENEYEQLPIFYIYYNENPDNKDDFMIPFYTDLSRTNLLALLPIQSNGNKNKKILASAALTLKD